MRPQFGAHSPRHIIVKMEYDRDDRDHYPGPLRLNPAAREDSNAIGGSPGLSSRH